MVIVTCILNFLSLYVLYMCVGTYIGTHFRTSEHNEHEMTDSDDRTLITTKENEISRDEGKYV